VFIEHLAHGVNTHESETEGKIGTARWITSVACLPYGDTFATGSWDGSIRVWSIAKDLKSFKPLLTIPAKGFINSLQLITPSAGQVDFTCFRSAPAALINGHAAEPSAPKESDAKLGLLLVATTSQEPRLGRWMRLKRTDGVRNGVVIAHLPVAGQQELDDRLRERESLEAEKAAAAAALEVDMD
jgi:ribosomal RNA-processing protein 9